MKLANQVQIRFHKYHNFLSLHPFMKHLKATFVKEFHEKSKRNKKIFPIKTYFGEILPPPPPHLPFHTPFFLSFPISIEFIKSTSPKTIFFNVHLQMRISSFDIYYNLYTYANYDIEMISCKFV